MYLEEFHPKIPPPTQWKQFFALIPRRTLSKNLVWGLCAQRTRYERRYRHQ